MQLLAHFNNVRMAYAFADYLNLQGIECKIVKTGNEADICLLNADDLDRAQHELKAYIENPLDKKYLSASWEGEATGTSRPDINSVYQDGNNHASKRWQQTGVFTKVILGICALVFLLTAFGSDRAMVNYFFFFTQWEQMFDVSQIWRWITPVFLHFGLLHFTFNLLWWWDIASVIERLQGSVRLINIFLVLAIIPNLMQFISAGHRFGGLSGVVYGVLGYVWVYGQLRPSYPLQLRPVIMYMMVGWMLIGFSGTLDNVVGPMANVAHLAGLVSGAVLGLLYGLVDDRCEKAEQDR